MISRTLSEMHEWLVAKIILYPTFVRPLLELASSFWNPHLKYDSNILESVQRSATLISELFRLPCHKRLVLDDLNNRQKRKKDDFIQISKNQFTAW